MRTLISLIHRETSRPVSFRPNWVQGLRTLACAVGLGLGALGCTPGFFDSSVDGTVQQQVRYRAPHRECSQLKLQEPRLDAPTFRHLVACLNATGSIAELENLVEQTPDSELTPILSVINESILNDPVRLGEFIESFRSLRAVGALDPVFQQLGWAMSHEAYVQASWKLLAQMLAREPESFFRALQRFSDVLDPKSAAELLDASLSVSDAPAFHSLVKSLSESSSSRSTETLASSALGYFKAGIPLLEKINQAGLIQKVYPALDQIFLAGKSNENSDVAARLQANIPSLALTFQTMTARGLGSDRVERDAALLAEVNQLARVTSQPIECVGGPRIQAGALYAMKEVARLRADELGAYLVRDLGLLLAAMSGTCQHPPEIARYFGAVQRIAQTNAIDSVPATLRAFDQLGLLGLFQEILADSALPTSFPFFAELAEQGAWEDLLLLISQPRSEDREAIARGLRFLVEPPAGFQRDSLISEMRKLFLAPDLAVWTDWLGHARVLLVEGRTSDPTPGASRATELLRALRTIHGSSPRFPWSRLGQELLDRAPERRAAIESWLRLSEKAAFPAAIRLTAQMGQDGRLQGLIADTLSLFEKFARERQGPQRTESRQRWVRAGNFLPWRRHSLSVRDLRRQTLETKLQLQPLAAACGGLDFSKNFLGYDDGSASSPVGSFLACLRSGDGPVEGSWEAARELGGVLEEFRRTKLDDGRSFMNFGLSFLDSITSQLRTQGNWADFGDQVVGALDRGVWHRSARLLPLLAADLSSPRHGSGWNGSFLEAAAQLPGIWRQAAAEELKRVLGVSGRLLQAQALEPALKEVLRIEDLRTQRTQRKPSRPGARLGLLADVDSEHEAVEEESLNSLGLNDLDEKKEDEEHQQRRRQTRIDRPEVDGVLATLVRSRECVSDAREVQRRVEEIKFDFLESKSNPLPGVYDYSIDDMKRILSPMFTKFADPRQNDPARSATQALVNVLNYFSLPLDPALPVDAMDPRRNQKQHYTAEYLARWLRERSTDYRPISYFYPGEKKPRVRLVNTLDTLELVLASANLTYILPDNFGMKFLAEIGEAWGDEPESVWPEEIKAKYRRGRRPKTLREAYDKIYRTAISLRTSFGFPRLPKCDAARNEPELPDVVEAGSRRGIRAPLYVRAAIYNALQVLPAVEGNLPDSGTAQAGGMKVLRDLFFELYYSTPVEYRNPRSGLFNNLQVIAQLVDAGLMRHISRQMMKFPELGALPEGYLRLQRDSELGPLVDVFRGLIAGAKAKESPQLLAAVFRRDPQHRLAWAFLERLFAVADSSAPRAARLRSSGFYLFAKLTHLGPLNGVVAAATDAIEDHSTYLARRSEWLEEAMRARETAGWLRDLYVHASPEGEQGMVEVLSVALESRRALSDLLRLLEVADAPQGSWVEMLWDRWEILKDSRDYRELDVAGLGRGLLDYLAATESGRTLRVELGRKLPSEGEVFLTWLASHPEDVQKLTESLTRLIENGSIFDTLETMRRALQAR